MAGFDVTAHGRIWVTPEDPIARVIVRITMRESNL